MVDTLRNPGKLSQGADVDYIRDYLLELYRATSDQHERDWCEDHFQFWKHYRNIVSRRRDPNNGHSNVGLGLAYPIVKILSSRLMAPWQAGDELIDAHANDAASKNKAPVVARYINDCWTARIPRMFSKVELTKESGVALGRGIIKPVVRWDPPLSLLKRVPIEVRNAVLGLFNAGSALRYIQRPSEPRFSFEYTDPFNFWWTGSSRWFQDADLSVERQYISDVECWKRMASGKWLSDADFEHLEPSGYDDYTNRRMELEFGGMVMASKTGDYGSRITKPHRLIEFQGWVQVKGTENGGKRKYEQRLVQILDEEVVVVNGKLDSWDGKPGYVVWEPYQDMAANRPMGVIEPMEDALLVCNDFVNIALDNARATMENPLAVDPEATDQTQIFWGPAEVNWIRNPTMSIQPLRVNDLPRSFFELIGFFQDVMQRNSGVTDYFGGMATADTARLTKTARGMQMMTELSSSRFAPLLTKADIEFYRPMAVITHETARQRFGTRESLRMPAEFGQQFVQVTQNDMDADLSFAFNLKALDLAQGRRRGDFVEMMSLLTNLAGTGQLGAEGYYLDVYETARILMEEFDRAEDAQKIIKRIQMGGLPMVGGMPAGGGATGLPPGGPFATPGRGMVPGSPIPADSGVSSSLPPLPPATA